MKKVTVEQIDALLPQTQCKECGYAGCRPYAEALLNQTETIDHCPPGGTETLVSLAELLNQDATPYMSEVANNTRPPMLAIIREDECIGCTKCIQACPVDAILGSAKQMHSVINRECTGCELCVSPCPVDCIDMIRLNEPAYDKHVARQRHEFQTFRLERNKKERATKHEKARVLQAEKQKVNEVAAKQEYIRAAVARARAKKVTT